MRIASRFTIALTRLSLLAGAALTALAAPTAAQACACGCGIFDVGDGSMTPQSSDSGLSAFLRYDFMNQDQNHEHGHDAPATDNGDKRIATDFFTIGANYMISQRWMIMAQVPLFDRKLTTTSPTDEGANQVGDFPLTDLGDAEVNLTYTGFAPDMSTGIGLGIKLPTGRDTSPTYPNFTQNPPYDRDSLPGTGSTDLQVVGYHVGHLGSAAHWFAQVQYRFAVASRGGYRPGNEMNGALGVSYDFATGGGRAVSPTLQLLGSLRAHDTGTEADPQNSGYQRLLLAPGVRVQVTRKLSIYGDVELPIAQYTNAASSPAADPGNTAGQLVAPALFKLQLNYGF